MGCFPAGSFAAGGGPVPQFALPGQNFNPPARGGNPFAAPFPTVTPLSGLVRMGPGSAAVHLGGGGAAAALQRLDAPAAGIRWQSLLLVTSVLKPEELRCLAGAGEASGPGCVMLTADPAKWQELKEAGNSEGVLEFRKGRGCFRWGGSVFVGPSSWKGSLCSLWRGALLFAM